MTPAYPLRTDRLVLRPLREDDIDVVLAYRNDPEVNALQDWDLPVSRERVERQVAEATWDDIGPGQPRQIGIEAAGELVGDLYVGLDGHGGVAEIGFTLRKEHQHQGYAGEAASAVVADLFGRLGCHRVFAQLSPENTASVRVLERIGMSAESVAPKSYWWRGIWDDNLVYAMSEPDWRAWQDRPRGAPQQVRLVELTHENWRSYQELRTHRSQEKFVAPVRWSMAEAMFPEPEGGWPVVPVLRGIEADGAPAGFIMWADAVNDGTPDPYLWRFLVDRGQQGRGIGRAALQLWVDEMRAAGHTAIETSWVQERGGPEPFYRALGFELTGEMDDDEAVARLELR